MSTLLHSVPLLLLVCGVQKILAFCCDVCIGATMVYHNLNCETESLWAWICVLCLLLVPVARTARSGAGDRFGDLSVCVLCFVWILDRVERKRASQYLRGLRPEAQPFAANGFGGNPRFGGRTPERVGFANLGCCHPTCDNCTTRTKTYSSTTTTGQEKKVPFLLLKKVNLFLFAGCCCDFAFKIRKIPVKRPLKLWR